MSKFTAKQKEIVARKLGYEGPMQGFDEFLQSSPALQMKYGMVVDKYMAKGGVVRKYAEGGAVTSNTPPIYTDPESESKLSVKLDPVGQPLSYTFTDKYGQSETVSASDLTPVNALAAKYKVNLEKAFSGGTNAVGGGLPWYMSSMPEADSSKYAVVGNVGAGVPQQVVYSPEDKGLVYSSSVQGANLGTRIEEFAAKPFAEVEATLKRYKQTPPKTQAELIEANSAWLDYQNRYSNNPSTGWEGAGRYNSELRPPSMSAKEYTDYGPLNEMLSGMSSNISQQTAQGILPANSSAYDLNQTIAALDANPLILQTIQKVKTVDPSVKFTSSDILNLSGQIQEIGANYAISNFLREKQNLLGLGSSNQSELQSMNNPVYAGYQSIMDEIGGLYASKESGSNTADTSQVKPNLVTEQEKIDEYNRLRDQGYSDSRIRTMINASYGSQTDSDWNYLVGKSRYASPTSATATQTSATAATPTSVAGGTQSTTSTSAAGAARSSTTPTTMTTSTTTGTGTGAAKQFNLNIDVKTATAQQKAAEYNRLRSEGFTDAEIRSGVDTALGTKQTDADWSALQGIASTGGTTYPATNPATQYGPTGVPLVGATQQVQAQQTDTTNLALDPTKAQYQLGTAPTGTVTKAADTQQATAGTVGTGQTYEASTALTNVQDQMNKLLPEQGTLSEGSKAVAQTGTLSEGALAKTVAPATAASVTPVAKLQQTDEMLAKAATVADVGGAPTAAAQTTDKTFTAQAAKFEGETPEAKAATDYTLGTAGVAKMAPTKVEAAAKAGEIPTAIAEQSKAQSTVEAQQRAVDEKELVDVARQGLQITEPIKAVAAVADKLNQDAIAIAQQANFDQALAATEQGRVESASTIQGQLTSLMQQFNDGTPAWAAGALRSANASMAARGLGGSSIAGAAIVQAAMEAATPIAAADAQVFAQMQLTNLNNRQQVALANAAASQNLQLANLNARQQAALQNSANAFAMQSQNLSNQQSVVLANAQFAAAVQQKNLDVKTSVALTNAAKYAEVNNLNLTNRQQANLQRSAENIQIDIANLNARQQTSLANLQVRAAIKGQELSNEQQMAVLQSTQNFEAAQFDATAQQQSFIAQFNADAALKGQVLSNQQQTALFNVSNIMQERGLKFNAEQQANMLNTTNAMQIELANLSNKQQTALANAQIEAALKGQELSNKQQVNITNAARVSEIAQVNFTAEQQNALANAQFIQQINLADMSNQQAVVLANAAATASMDMANLNAKQQAAVQNAQAFLAMDMANLDNAQKTALFKVRQLTQVALSDAAAENAAKQFNAANKQQADQFSASLTTQVSQFNAAQTNAMNQFNAGQENAMEQFNSQMKSQREQFNVTNRTVIDQANAQLLAQVSTANTAAVNAANFANAQAMNNMTMAQYNNEVMLYRDQVKMVYDSYERGEDRAASMAEMLLSAGVQRDKLDAETSAAWGKLLTGLTGTEAGGKIIEKVGDVLDWLNPFKG